MPWQSENERLGMIACTRRGYNLLGAGEFTALFGVILFWAVFVWLIWVPNKLSVRDLWWLMLPASVIIAGQVISRIGWWLAESKQFHYDYDSNSVTWIEDGRQHVYPESAAPLSPADPR
jgi:hypothetical protein